jgi:hypothetical protein
MPLWRYLGLPTPASRSDMKEAYQSPDGTWRIDDVPIVTTGIEYSLSSGPCTFTEDDLMSAVLAIGDPAIKPPRIKLGHTSGYNTALIGDAEQAFGRVENLKMGNFNQTIYGDYVGMPEWLAKVVPIAYPSRSIEGDKDIETNTGHNYAMVVYAVSLLGVRWPGVSTLEDLPLYYGSDQPEGVEVDLLNSAIAGGGMKPGDKLRAAVDVSMVDRKFYGQYEYGDDQYWWWIRAERFDDASGLQLIVDCDDGSLVRIPVSVSGSDVSFGDPVEVTEEYPDKIAAASFVAGMAASERSRGVDVLVYASRADTHGDRPEVKATNGGTMDEATRKSLATRVGLDPETATEDEVNAKITELAAQALGDGGDGQDPPEGDPPEVTPAPGAPAQVPAALLGGAPTPPVNGVVTIDAERLATLERNAQQGAEFAAASAQERRDTFLDAAVRAGKFSPARKQHYAALLASDPVGGKELIDGLSEGTIPLTERGSAGNGDEMAGGAGGGDGLVGMDANLDRDIANIRAGQVPGKAQNGRIMQAKEA